MSFKSLLYSWKFRIAFGLISGIVFKILIDVVFVLLYRQYNMLKPWETYVLSGAATIGIIQCFYLVTKFFDNSILWDVSAKKRFLIQFTLQTFVVILVFGLLRWLYEYIITDDYFVVIKNEVVILIACVLLTMFFNVFELGLFLTYKWRHSLAELERFKKENAEFKFETLQSQVNPHFLFNSLNTLSSVMYENVDTAADYIRQLSQVYRYVLENRQRDLIELNKELDFIAAYKYLFELRFTDRLKINITIDLQKEDYFIAPMTMQMLIENAVKHNVISQKMPLFISVFIDNKYLIVENTLQKKSPEGYSSGMGLKNISSRYEFISDRKVNIINDGEKFRVEVPLIEKTGINIQK